MAIVKMSEAKIAKLQIPPGITRIEWCDVDTPGLYLLATTKGAVRTWFLRYKDQTGKTCHEKLGRTTDMNLAAARARAKQLRAEIALGADPRREAKAQREVPTLTEFFEGADGYLGHVKSRKRSWRRDEELYRLRIKDVFGRKRLNQITRQQVQAFHTALLDEGLAPASCDHHVKLMRQALNLAVDWQLLEKNPLTRIPLFNADNKVENYLEGDQLERFVQTLRTDRNRPVALVALWLLSTGARLNEALRATWDQIDQPNRVWRIPALNSKSKRVRSVPLNDSALDVLKEVGTEGKFEHVFVSARTGARLTTINKQFDRIRTSAGLEKHYRIHDLRHTFASALVSSNRTLYEVQKILGHSNSSVTERYSHLSAKSLQDAADTASVLIKGASKPAIPVMQPPADGAVAGN